MDGWEGMCGKGFFLCVFLVMLVDCFLFKGGLFCCGCRMLFCDCCVLFFCHQGVRAWAVRLCVDLRCHASVPAIGCFLFFVVTSLLSSRRLVVHRILYVLFVFKYICWVHPPPYAL